MVLWLHLELVGGTLAIPGTGRWYSGYTWNWKMVLWLYLELVGGTLALPGTGRWCSGYTWNW